MPASPDSSPWEPTPPPLLTTPAPDAAQVEDFIFGGNLAGLPLSGLGNRLLVYPFPGCRCAGLRNAVAYAIGRLTLRLSGDYLAIATIGIAEAVRLMFLNEKWIANGSKGLYRIPEFLGHLVSPANYDYLFLVVVLVVLALLYLAVQRAVNSPWGRVLRAIREDEVAAQASGKDVYSFKLQAFILGSIIMGIGGALYAHHVRFIAPITFDPLLATFVIWAMLMVGGSGNNRGAILGAFVVWGIWSGTQFLPWFFADPNFRFFMIGVLIVGVILIRPGGILGETRRVSEDKSGDVVPNAHANEGGGSERIKGQDSKSAPCSQPLGLGLNARNRIRAARTVPLT